MKGSSLSSPMHTLGQDKGDNFGRRGQPHQRHRHPTATSQQAQAQLCLPSAGLIFALRHPKADPVGSRMDPATCTPPRAFVRGSPRHPDVSQGPLSPPFLGCVYFNTNVSSNKKKTLQKGNTDVTEK